MSVLMGNSLKYSLTPNAKLKNKNAGNQEIGNGVNNVLVIKAA
jgi:hypothetical protein